VVIGVDVRDDGADLLPAEPGHERLGRFGGDAAPLPGRADHPGDLGGVSHDRGLDRAHQAARVAQLDDPVAPGDLRVG
jgi:hypothetical protein